MTSSSKIHEDWSMSSIDFPKQKENYSITSFFHMENMLSFSKSALHYSFNTFNQWRRFITATELWPKDNHNYQLQKSE